MACPCCFIEDDNQMHIISCGKLTNAKVSVSEYNAIFENSDETIAKMIAKMEILVAQRNFIIESNKES